MKTWSTPIVSHADKAETTPGGWLRLDDVVIYDCAAYHSNPWRLMPEALAVIAPTFIGCPIMERMHETDQYWIGRQEESAGVILSCWVVGSELHASMDIWRQSIITDHERKVKLCWSVCWDNDANTQTVCSKCGEDPMDPASDCDDWIGWDGSEILYSSARGFEVTRTYMPSVDKTGTHATQDGSLLQAAHKAAHKRLVRHQNGEETMPENLTIEAGPGDGQATLSWDPMEGATGYNVHRSDTEGQAAEAEAIATVEDASYVDDGLEPGDYFYVVVATFDEAEDVASEEVSVTIEETAGDDGDGDESADQSGEGAHSVDPDPDGGAGNPAHVARHDAGDPAQRVRELEADNVRLARELAQEKAGKVQTRRSDLVAHFRRTGRITGAHKALVAMAASEGCPSLDWLDGWMSNVPASQHMSPNLRSDGSQMDDGEIVIADLVANVKNPKDVKHASETLADQRGCSYKAAHAIIIKAIQGTRAEAGSRHTEGE